MTDELQPGRELDALVAEKVFGWTGCDPKAESAPWEFGDPPEPRITVGLGLEPGDDGYYGPEPFPNYSTDIAAAWLVVLEIGSRIFSKRKGFLEELTRLVRERTGQPVAWPDVFWFVTPELICLAALQAVAALPEAAPPHAA
jgi:hypothetical protein